MPKIADMDEQVPLSKQMAEEVTGTYTHIEEQKCGV